MTEKEFDVFKFAGANIPDPYETVTKSDDKYVPWGNKNYFNLYPNYLLRLYSESPIHAAIVNKKASMILGNGLKLVNGDSLNITVNDEDTLDDFLNKILKDFVIFNGFAVEVTYDKAGQPLDYYHVPFQDIRTNNSKSRFWYSQNWVMNTKPHIYERAWLINRDSTSKIFFYDGYIPGMNDVYPEPEYKSIIKTLETDIAIREFNLNNIKNHFSPSKIITFFRGSNPIKKGDILQKIENSYTGENGKKLIIDFQDPGQPPADVKDLSAGDWDKQYELIRNNTLEEIYQGHQVTSPMLFGVKTPQQLGGGNELETSHEIFKNDYINPKRNEIASALNKMFRGYPAIKGKVEFEDKQVFSTILSEESKLKVYTLNEMRHTQNLPPIAGGEKLIAEIEKAATSAPAQFAKSKVELREDDFEKIKDLGLSNEEFEFVADGEFVSSKEDFNRIELQFEQSQEIADYIIENDLKNKSLAEIKKGLRIDTGINISTSELKDTIKKLTDAGVLDTKESKPSRKIEVMYSYEVRSGLGSPVIAGTRPFCKKLIDNNRLYKLEDIQTMSSIFGYDIFQFGGGYFHDSETGKITPHCRHFFKSKTVVRKPK